MRATEIIRGLLDIIDDIDSSQEPESVAVIEPQSIEIATQPTDDINHFKQIVDMLSQGTDATYANEPNEVVADIAAVTTDAGGGVNGPKDPADLRGDSVRIYGSN